MPKLCPKSTRPTGQVDPNRAVLDHRQDKFISHHPTLLLTFFTTHQLAATRPYPDLMQIHPENSVLKKNMTNCFSFPDLGRFLLINRLGPGEKHFADRNPPRATRTALSSEYSMTPLTNKKGFTLVEVMVVVAILGIIAAIGTTGLLRSLPTMRLKSAARDIFSAAMQAKAEAVRRGENVTILFDTANNTWLMFLDRQPPTPPPAIPGPSPATDDNEALDAGETVLLAATPLPDRVSYDPNLVVNGTPHADGVSFANNALVFSPRGIPAGAGGGLGGGTVGLRAVDSSGATLRQRTVVVSTAGRVKMD